MNENQPKQDNLLDTTDCLEAIGVFRGWKNFLFVIAICCLLLLQLFFWLVNIGYVKSNDTTQSDPPAAVADNTVQPDEIHAAAEKATIEPNQSSKASPPEQPQKTDTGFSIKLKHLTLALRFVNFVLIFSSTLYCLTMLFSLKVSLLGRLGGINHISRAFFLSLTFLVLLLPWQKCFPGVVAGAIFTSQELLSRYDVAKTATIFGTAFYYLRFVGLGLVVMLLLVVSQLRSFRWAKTILRRLEVI